MKEWLPDWKNPENYLDPETTTPEMWAWEFLRRNPLYRKDYSNFDQYLKNINYESAYRKFYEDDSLSEQERIEIKKTLSGAMADRSMVAERYYLNSISLNELPSPSKPYSEKLFDPSEKKNLRIFRLPNRYGKIKPDSRGRYFVTRSYIDENQVYDQLRLMNRQMCEENRYQSVSLTMHPRSLLVEISLDGNINKQIRQLKQIAALQQNQLKDWGIGKKRSRKAKEYYREYLRCLDAIELGASKDDIVKCLLPNDSNEFPDYTATKKINNWIRRAEELRDRDYLALLNL